MHVGIMNRKWVGGLIFVLFLSQEASGQSFIWNAGMHGFFDNRELFNDYTQPQTIFGARTFASFGLALNDHQEFAAGVDLLFEFGSETGSIQPEPILYFSHDSKHSEIKIGAFPRRSLVNMPLYMLSDTLNYYRSNIEGTFIEFRTSWGFQNIWLDWTSRQTDVNRETFLLGGTGGLRKGLLFYRHHFMMFHYAGPAVDIENDHIRDNGGLNVLLGLDLSSKTPLDTLVISSGFSFSYDRLRNVYDTRYYYGSLSELRMSYKGIGIRNTLSVGDGMVQMMGDPMFKAGFYNRSDIFWRFFRDGAVQGRAEFSVHFLPADINFSQRLVIFVRLDGFKPLKARNISGIG